MLKKNIINMKIKKKKKKAAGIQLKLTLPEPLRYTGISSLLPDPGLEGKGCRSACFKLPP